MDTLSAMLRAQVAQASNSKMKVFDWNKAAFLIKIEKAKIAEAGLAGDWEWTGGTIFNNRPLLADESYTYLASLWATPQIIIDGVEYDCWCFQSEHPEWGSDTRWPQSALDILKA